MTAANKLNKLMDGKRLLKYACATRAVALLLVTICTICAYLTFLCFSLPAHAASTTGGRIYGQLLNGSHKNTPVGGERVTLQMAQGNNAIDLSSAITDVHGSYSFANLAINASTRYAVYIKYQGAQYTSAIVSLATKADQQVNLTIYDSTTSTANLAIVRATILLQTPNAQNGIIPVSELFIFRNLDNRTYVGSLNASQGKPNALRFSLPHTASKAVLGKGFDGYNAIQVNNGFASDAAVPPGDSQFAFTFDMPYSASEYDFNYTAVYPTVLMAFLTPPEIQASSDTLSSQGPITSDQHTYNLLEGKALLANKEVHVQLENLPIARIVTDAPPSTPSNTGMSWLVVALLIMMAILAVTWVIYRSIRRQASSTSYKGRSNGKQRSARPKQHIQTQRQQKVTQVKSDNSDSKVAVSEQVLLQELLELDKTYEAGKIKKTVYQERRAKIKTQLRSLLSEQVTP